MSQNQDKHEILDPTPQPAGLSPEDAGALEWPKLCALLAGYASFAASRERLLASRPSTSAQWIEREHELVSQAGQLLLAQVSVPLARLFDPSELLSRAALEGTSLEAAQILELTALAGSIAAWQNAMLAPPDKIQGKIAGLLALSEPILTSLLTPLVTSIEAKLEPDGSLRDDASPALGRIRREQERQKRHIESSLQSALRRLNESGAAQLDQISIRGERFVIPVKAEHRRRIPGVVHGASSSGQTVYVEPLDTIEQNNELTRLLDEEQEEILRIFAQITAQIAEFAPVLVKGFRVLLQVDGLLARAKFAADYACIRPSFTAKIFSLLQARHPLLERRLRQDAQEQGNENRKDGIHLKSGVVPLTLVLDSGHRQLIISGPNTGGKTIALKTGALLALMAQSGIPIPAEAAELPVFSGFLADIGDAQSIDRALSTFSAHIVNLERIVRLTTPHSLIVLDELGSATDPEEGAALAVAVARYFLDRQACSIVSTHHTSLKVYAAGTQGVANASVTVDEVTLLPTYELRMGVPGTSAGIQTAERLGLDSSIIAAARARMSTQTVDIGRFLDDLHAQLEKAAEERRALALREQELHRERTRLEREGAAEARARTLELEKKLASLLKDFEYQIRETIRAVEDRAVQQKLGKEAERRVARLRREFEEQFNSTVVAHRSGADQGDENAQPHIVRNVSVGDTVRLKSLGRTGSVVRLIDAALLEVAVGPMKMRVRRDDVAEVVSSARPVAVTPLAAASRQRGITVSVDQDADSTPSELNVIGRTVDEATDELSRFLDRAFLAGLPRVRIVHGTGMGVLRRSLRAWLEHHPQVRSIAEPPHMEGGQGVTVAELKQ